MLPPPRFSISGATARDNPMSEYALTSSAIRNPSREVCRNELERSAAVANAAPCSRKSRPPNSRSREAASAAICSSLETSHGSTSGSSSFAASSRTFSSSRSLGYVSARRAPAAAAVCAIAHEIDRLFATPTMRPCLPARSDIRRRRLFLPFGAVPPREPRHGALRRTAALSRRASGHPTVGAVAELLAAVASTMAEPVLTAAGIPYRELGRRARWRRLTLGPRKRRANQRAVHRPFLDVVFLFRPGRFRFV